MNMEFVQETAEQEPRRHPGFLTGWELIVFQVEDEPRCHPERSEGSQTSKA